MVHVAPQPVSEPALSAQRVEAITRFFAALRAGDYPVLEQLLTPGAVTRWPQSGERITGATSCVMVHANYPGGPPSYRVQRISGGGQVWFAELVADYGDERWYPLSIIEFEGSRIARITDYFAPSFPAPAWRQDLVEREDVVN